MGSLLHKTWGKVTGQQGTYGLPLDGTSMRGSRLSMEKVCYMASRKDGAPSREMKTLLAACGGETEEGVFETGQLRRVSAVSESNRSGVAANVVSLRASWAAHNEGGGQQWCSP
jgi:hypothetical protein